jgi:hypothetical protein
VRPVDNGALPASDHVAPAWWPPELGPDPPDDLLLVLVSAGGTPEERWNVEPWPRIGTDGRLRRGSVVADQPPDEPADPPLFVGSALARVAPPPGDRAVFAARVRGVAEGDTNLLSRRVADISPETWAAALAAAIWTPYAWTYWAVWRGDPDLIAHVGRTVKWAFLDVLGRDAQVRTTVEVEPDDVERFDTPAAIVAELTAHGARHMRAVKIESALEGITVLVRANSGENAADPALSKAVLLEVTSSKPEGFAAVRTIHNRTRAALERGCPGSMSLSESMVGHLALDDAGTALPGVTRTPASAAASRNQGWLLLAVLVFFVLSVLPIFGVLVSNTTILVMALIVLGAAGALVAHSLFGGGVMLGTSNRVLKLKASAVGLAGGAVSAGVGIGINQLAELL